MRNEEQGANMRNLDTIEVRRDDVTGMAVLAATVASMVWLASAFGV